MYDVDEHTTFWIVYTDDGFYTDRDNVPLYWLSLPQLPIDFHPQKENKLKEVLNNVHKQIGKN